MNNNKEKFCPFCKHDVHEVDYKDTRLLHNFINIYKKILPTKRTGVCAWHQRKLANAIKRARIIALLPFVR